MRGILRAAVPRLLPPLAALLLDLGEPEAAELAAFLGVHVRTVRRWLAQDDAPRPVLLSLFWLTRWGRSQVAADAVNAARLAQAQARAATEAAAAAQTTIAHLVRVGDFGAANDAAEVG